MTKSKQYFMNTTIIVIGVLYVAFTSLVLLTFRSMRDRNVAEPEYCSEEEQTVSAA